MVQSPMLLLSIAVANSTGFILFEYSICGKWLELLKEIALRITRAAVIRGLHRRDCQLRDRLLPVINLDPGNGLSQWLLSLDHRERSPESTSARFSYGNGFFSTGRSR